MKNYFQTPRSDLIDEIINLKEDKQALEAEVKKLRDELNIAQPLAKMAIAHLTAVSEMLDA